MYMLHQRTSLHFQLVEAQLVQGYQSCNILFTRFTLFMCSFLYFRQMCIGIIYDAQTSDYWYRIEKDVNHVRAALQSVRLPLPVACIFDTTRNEFVELNEDYRRHRKELLERTRNILQKYLQSDSKITTAANTRKRSRRESKHV
jgi:hypothetical protein